MKLSLKAIRATKNLTLKNASILIGISIDTLSKYERGITFPDVPIIQKIEKAYGVKYDDIIFLTNDYD